MSKNKEYRYRAICPHCGKPFDTRLGQLFWGELICQECEQKMRHYNTINDYRKDLRKRDQSGLPPLRHRHPFQWGFANFVVQKEG